MFPIIIQCYRDLALVRPFVQHLTTVRYDFILNGFSYRLILVRLLNSIIADLLNNILSLDNSAEHHVDIIESRGLGCGNIELRGIGVFCSAIGHSNLVRLIVFIPEILV